MRRTRRDTLLALAAASFLALLEVFRTTMTRGLEGHPLGGFELFHRLVPMWLTIVLASPWCAFMARRFPLRGGGLVRTLLAHLAGAVVFVAIHLTLLLAIHAVLQGAADLPTGFRLAHLYAFYVGMEMSVYAAIVGVLLFVEERRTSTARELAHSRLEQGLSRARLESLQSQIRPHFLFNTLNTLAVLARRGDGAAVDRAIGDLGELLRASFDTSRRHEIPLGEELEFLERYLRLQALRFPDRLEMEWAVSDEARAGLVPALLVQPLIENALEHGLATARGGRMRLAARRLGERLELLVSDDGPGFGSTPQGAEPGVGLANTRERLALLYGEAGTLATGERAGGGAEVRIELPWHTTTMSGNAS